MHSNLFLFVSGWFWHSRKRRRLIQKLSIR